MFKLFKITISLDPPIKKEMEMSSLSFKARVTLWIIIKIPSILMQLRLILNKFGIFAR